MTTRKPPEPRVCKVHNRYFPAGWPTCVVCDMEAESPPDGKALTED
jgi:hypothetical protein